MEWTSHSLRETHSLSAVHPAMSLGNGGGGLGRLAGAGAKIRIHPSLHAKVYVFKRKGEQQMFAVGSSNLTFQGMGFSWAECNVRGYHPVEWELVDRHALGVTRQKGVTDLDEWDALLRRSGNTALIAEVFR